MSLRVLRNLTGADRTLSFCVRPSHWSTDEHDDSDGEPEVLALVDVPHGAVLVTDAAANNAAEVEAVALGLGFTTVE